MAHQLIWNAAKGRSMNMSKNGQSVVMEAMEGRVFLDASQLTEVIDSSTLPAAISDHAVLRGVVSVTVSNHSGSAFVGRAAVGVTISNGTLDVPGKNFLI